MGSMYFEEFVVGETFHTGERSVTVSDLKDFTAVSGDCHPLHVDADYARTTRFGERIIQGTFGLAVFAGLFHDLHLIDDSVVAMLDSNWSYHAPIKVGDTLKCTVTITRCRRTSAGDHGVVGRYIEILNQEGKKAQSGTSAVLVQASGSGPDSCALAFATVPWAQAIAQRLSEDFQFIEGTSEWDGTLGLRCGRDEVHLRVYRGSIVEVTRRTPLGATFTLVADELTWTRILTRPDNDFMRSAISGKFQVVGNGYEYLRMSKILDILFRHARALVATS